MNFEQFVKESVEHIWGGGLQGWKVEAKMLLFAKG